MRLRLRALGGGLRRLPALFGSLRWRLTLTYVALLALLLVGFAVYEDIALQRSLVTARAAALRGDFQEGLTLSARAAGVRPIGGTSPQALRASLCSGINATPLGTAPRAAAQELARRIGLAAGSRIDVLVLNRHFDIVAHAPAATPTSEVPRLSSSPFDTALRGREPAPEVIDTPRGAQIVAAYPIAAAAAGQPAGTVCGITQLSVSTAQVDQVLHDSRRRLALGAAAVLLVALIFGLVLTSRALSGLRRLTLTARELAAGNLRARSRLAPRSDEVGRLAHSFDDMAERIEGAFAAQAESEARMRRFIADASHELRTPVTALKGYIDVLRLGASREPEALEASLGAMAREADRMRGLILDLLTLARLDTQRQQRLEPVDLGSAIAVRLDEGVPGMPEVVERQLGGARVVVEADRAALSTIVGNLLVNACKYAPAAPQRWSVWREGERGWFAVADQGPGISAADLPHVFERFYRGEKTRAREEGGSGLGLSIVQGLARAMGGDVAIRSEEGRETAVSVWLPAVPDDGPGVAAAEGAVQPAE